MVLVSAMTALMFLVAACGDGATATPGPTATPTVIETIVEVTPTPTVLSTQQVVDSYVRAINAEDVPALVNLWALDGTFTFGPLPDGSSETENGLASDLQDIGRNPVFDLTEVTIVGEAATGLFSFTSDETADFGGPLTGSFELALQQGKIQSIDATPDEATQARLAEVFGSFEPREPRELTALVGAGRDTEAIVTFLPARLTVRAGDTVTWKINTDEIHTVSFLSGAPVPGIDAPIPGGGPGDLMLNPQIAFPTRGPVRRSNPTVGPAS